MKKALLLYLPVIHRGYVELMQKHDDAETVFLIGQMLIKKLSTRHPKEVSLRSLVRDPRCLENSVAQTLISNLLPSANIYVLETMEDLNLEQCQKLIMPDEEVCRFLCESIYVLSSQCKIEFERTFLRWDMPSTIANVPVDSDYTITSDDLVMLGISHVQERAFAEACKSSDWWRQIGGILFRDKEILLASSNRHLPTELETAFKGDPRSNFQAGEYIEFSSAIHAEAGLIGTAASQGICTKGLEIFTTTFPCPACAALIAIGHFKRLYFVDGYSNVNALQTLRDYDVEIVQVI